MTCVITPQGSAAPAQTQWWDVRDERVGGLQSLLPTEVPLPFLLPRHVGQRDTTWVQTLKLTKTPPRTSHRIPRIWLLTWVLLTLDFFSSRAASLSNSLSSWIRGQQEPPLSCLLWPEQLKWGGSWDGPFSNHPSACPWQHCWIYIEKQACRLLPVLYSPPDPANTFPLDRWNSTQWLSPRSAYPLFQWIQAQRGRQQGMTRGTLTPALPFSLIPQLHARPFCPHLWFYDHHLHRTPLV